MGIYIITKDETNVGASTSAVEKSSFVAAREVFEDGPALKDHLFFPTNAEFVRRHSISVINRTPPRGSVAEELINPVNSYLLNAKFKLSELKDMTERLSEFGSCISNHFYYQLGDSNRKE